MLINLNILGTYSVEIIYLFDYINKYIIINDLKSFFVLSNHSFQ